MKGKFSTIQKIRFLQKKGVIAGFLGTVEIIKWNYAPDVERGRKKGRKSVTMQNHFYNHDSINLGSRLIDFRTNFHFFLVRHVTLNVSFRYFENIRKMDNFFFRAGKCFINFLVFRNFNFFYTFFIYICF